jgi:RimJ/RimL family protein N-acetyltransferase
MMKNLTTRRLTLRPPRNNDAAFLLRLLNDPDWLRYIGDRGVRTEADALDYINERLLGSFHRHGFGLWVVEASGSDTPLGVCGLLKRETLEDVDIGYAFLPEGRGSGYALEAAQRTLEFAAHELQLPRVVAITKPENAASSRLLERLGLSFEQMIDVETDQPLRLYGIRLAAPKR